MRPTFRTNYISLVLFTFFSSLVLAQDVEFRRLDSPDGGAFDFITGIKQDKDGNMWISSKGGLLRHNGTKITTYQHNPLNTNSVSTNNLESVFADGDGKIWIGSLGSGLDRLDPKTGIFEHFRHDPDNPASISNDTITAILRTTAGDLLIGTHQGLNKYDADNKEFVHFKHDSTNLASISNNQVRVIYEDRQGNIWVGTGSPYVDNGGGPEDGGLNLFHKDQETFTRYLHDPDVESSLLNNKISAIYEDQAGTLWVGTAALGIHKMNREEGTFERSLYDLAHPENLGIQLSGEGISDYEHITFITEDSSGDYWYGTVENGVFQYDLSEGRINSFITSENLPDQFEGSGAWTGFNSRDGVLWLGAVFPGNIFTVNPNSIKFEFDSSATDVQGFYHAPNKDLYLTTGSGYYIKNSQGETTRHTLKNPMSPQGNWVSQFKEDAKGRLWVAGMNGLNYRDDPDADWEVFNLNPEDGPGPQGAATTILFDSKNNFWVGSIHGLCRINPETGEVFRTFMRRRDSSVVGMNVVSCLLETDQGKLWVGLFNGGGIHLFDPESDSVEQYLRSVDLLDLHRDKSGVAWAATSDGLYWFDKSGDKFVRYVNPFLSSGVPGASSVLEDDYGNLWVSSIIGMVQISQDREQVSVYGRDQGVGSNNFQWDSGYKDENGHIYFGNDIGYYVADPDILKDDVKAPEISLTGFRLADEYLLPTDDGPLSEDLSIADQIELNYDQNVFSFDFATIDFTNPDRNRMIYYLENYDVSWTLANSENRAYYFNVPPGTYTFRVKATKGYGPWASKEIKLTIAPPWWKTWWAYSAYAIIFGLLIFGFDRFMRHRLIRIERQRSQEKELKQAKEIEKAYKELKNTQSQLIQSEKMASLGELTAGIAHEIQNPLNFVNNFSELSHELLQEMKEELDKGEINEAKELSGDIEKNLEKISHHGKRASDIVKGMLQHSRAGGATKEPTDLNNLADEYFRLAFHGLRAKDKSFSAKMESSFDEKLEKISVIPQDIGRVLLNVITNAFHVVSEKKKDAPEDYQPLVTLSTKNFKDKVEIKVTDNGNGIPKKLIGKIFQPFFTTKPSGKGTGLGLSLSYDIVKAHGGDLLVETKEGEGTTFTIHLPKS